MEGSISPFCDRPAPASTKATSSTPAASFVRFFDLPLELRANIYRFAFSDISNIIYKATQAGSRAVDFKGGRNVHRLNVAIASMHHVHPRPWDYARLNALKMFRTLSLVSRFVRQDSRAAFFRQVTFTISILCEPLDDEYQISVYQALAPVLNEVHHLTITDLTRPTRPDMNTTGRVAFNTILHTSGAKDGIKFELKSTRGTFADGAVIMNQQLDNVLNGRARQGTFSAAMLVGVLRIHMIHGFGFIAMRGKNRLR